MTRHRYDQGIKQIYNGVVGLRTWSASPICLAHEAVVLESDNGSALKIFVQDQNPFRNHRLDPFIGQRVSIEGMDNNNRLYVASLSDIKVQPKP